jgi:hypothetical protein
MSVLEKKRNEEKEEEYERREIGSAPDFNFDEIEKILNPNEKFITDDENVSEQKNVDNEEEILKQTEFQNIEKIEKDYSHLYLDKLSSIQEEENYFKNLEDSEGEIGKSLFSLDFSHILNKEKTIVSENQDGNREEPKEVDLMKFTKTKAGYVNELLLNESLILKEFESKTIINFDNYFYSLVFNYFHSQHKLFQIGNKIDELNKEIDSKKTKLYKENLKVFNSPTAQCGDEVR